MKDGQDEAPGPKMKTRPANGRGTMFRITATGFVATNSDWLRQHGNWPPLSENRQHNRHASYRTHPQPIAKTRSSTDLVAADRGDELLKRRYRQCCRGVRCL
jgi:hypothetical protein